MSFKQFYQIIILKYFLKHLMQYVNHNFNGIIIFKIYYTCSLNFQNVIMLLNVITELLLKLL